MILCKIIQISNLNSQTALCFLIKCNFESLFGVTEYIVVLHIFEWCIIRTPTAQAGMTALVMVLCVIMSAGHWRAGVHYPPLHTWERGGGRNVHPTRPCPPWNHD